MERENRRSRKSERWNSREEERVWIGFYRRVADPLVAADLMEQMEADSEVKARHLGLYLRCKQSLRQEKARRARARAIAHLLQTVARVLIVQPVSLARYLLRFLGTVCMMSASTDEPAVRQMHKIRRGRSVSPKMTGVPKGEENAAAKQA